MGVITVAFVADPAMRWLYPDPAQYLTGCPQLVRAFGRRTFAHGSAHEVSKFGAVAIWLPRGIEADERALRPGKGKIGRSGCFRSAR